MFNISKLCKNVHKLGHKYRSTHKVKQTYNKDPRQNTNKKGLHRFPKKAATHPTFFWDGTSGGIHAGIQEHQTMFRSKLRVKLPVMSPWTFPSSVRPSSPQSSVAKVHPTMHGYLYWRHVPFLSAWQKPILYLLAACQNADSRLEGQTEPQGYICWHTHGESHCAFPMMPRSLDKEGWSPILLFFLDYAARVITTVTVIELW